MTLLKPRLVRLDSDPVLSIQAGKALLGSAIASGHPIGTALGYLGFDTVEFAVKKIVKARGLFPEYNPGNILESAELLIKKVFSKKSNELK